ncbi:hypothetical protein CHO01_31970 [Cellulomonas hominis]|uniref:Crossover junction endodeoxyribonuclease RuvC n=1 Tax=Cellulomonas hominis TaxID=156981 RepID=A0A511FFT6_9CELL|nr:hypothetical protein [Cellulomonas hominis]MBB5474857.1 crossover junction endodeoxyribonuclease RuvC [Cellulomonas hominis]NKY05937.1 hypothetical protein [Cellulomonas hominis]GEL48081.1 hypothetical protein CHO01_31970 [Cellulomonas hominis]
MSATPFVVGLDLSLTSTGVALIAHDLSVRTVLEKSKGTRADTITARRARLRDLADRVLARCTGATLAAIEAPAYSQAAGAGSHDRSGLWWLVVDGLVSAGVPVIQISPSSRPTYATGKGNSGKDAVIIAVTRRYWGVEIADNNEADALVLGAMGARLLGRPIEGSLPQTHLRAMDKLTLPPGLVPLAAAAAA